MTIEQVLLTQGMTGAEALADVAVRSTLLLVVAGTVALALRKGAARVRHRVWVLALAGVLSLPLAGAIVSGLSLGA